RADLTRRPPVNRHVPQPHRPAVRTQDAGHDLEQRRLAGAVGSDDTDDLAGLGAQVDALEDLVARRVAGHDAVHGEERGHGAGARRPRYAVCTRASAATSAKRPSASRRPSAMTMTGSHRRAMTS